ncbi:MAG: nodulation protein NfeD [Chlorobi bacterium]|nr:nodulation protein NfeD [Chlorobiota bacterium]
MKKGIILILTYFIFVVSSINILGSNSLQDSLPAKKLLVYKFNIKQQIGPAIWRQTKQSFENARELNADLILIQMNTYGGLLDAADSIRTTILNCKIPVYVFIDNNAASAGALISIACDRIYMRAGGNIGSATVVDQSGKPMPDKYQAYMRSMMRSTAESHGKDTLITGKDTIYKWKRDPRIAEAMVDPDVYIAGIIDTGKVLTFTTQEAIKNGFCEGQAENIKEVLKLAQVDEYEIKEYEVSPLESLIGFLVNPVVHGLLIMIIIGGIYFELQTPGIGFPIGAAILAAVLYFAPLYLEGLAENWEIIVFIIGVILIALEIFAIPGFGVAGVSGILLVITGLTLSLVGNVVFTFNQDAFGILFKALSLVMISIFLSIVLSIYFGSKLLKSSALNFLVLNTTQQKDDGYLSVTNDSFRLIGESGIATSILRPAGKVKIKEDYYDAKSQFGYINKGEKIIVIDYKSGQLYVKKLEG